MTKEIRGHRGKISVVDLASLVLIRFSCLPPVWKVLSEARKAFQKIISWCQSRFLGRGCDEALFSEKKGFSVKRGEAIQ